MRAPYFIGPDGDKLALAMLKWVGVPFQDHGRSRHGVDCVGLPLTIYQEAGLLPKDYESPPYALSGGRHLKESPLEVAVEAFGCFEKVWEPEGVRILTLPNFMPGDLLLMRFGRMPFHSGLALGAGSFIHAHPVNGVARAGIEDPTYRKLLTGLYRPMKD